MAASLFVSLVAALTVVQPTAIAALKTLSLDLEVRQRNSALSPLLKRDVVGGNITNVNVAYLAIITVGTPPQRMPVFLDTGSSDLWVPGVGSEICHDFPDVCRQSGSYDMEISSTEKDLHKQFTIGYGDGTRVNGTFITESLGFGGTTVEDVRMAVGLSRTNVDPSYEEPPADSAIGIWGIGVDYGEHGVLPSHSNAYLGFVSQLALKGHIHTRAYSIWLGDPGKRSTPVPFTYLMVPCVDDASGRLLFGGIDASKYTGPLQLLPIVDPPIPDVDGPRLAVQMTSLALYDEHTDQPGPLLDSVFRITLDTGSTLSYLPVSVVDWMYRAVGPFFDDRVPDTPYIDCNLTSSPAGFSFGFGGPQGPKIRVPLSVLVFRLEDVVFPDGRFACRLGVRGTRDPPSYLLGDTFLRSAYTVFDLENKRIAIAQAASDVDMAKSSGGVEEITVGDNGIPGVRSTFSALPWPASAIEVWTDYQSSVKAAAIAQTTKPSAVMPTLTTTETLQGPLTLSGFPSMGLISEMPYPTAT
ncbi:MAG: hypothetical protein Q9218_008051 [Villophora microphyllina]